MIVFTYSLLYLLVLFVSGLNIYAQFKSDKRFKLKPRQLSDTSILIMVTLHIFYFILGLVLLVAFYIIELTAY